MSVNMIHNLLEKLEGVIAKGIALVPFSYSIVNAKKIEEIIDKISLALPKEITEAREIIKRRDEIIIEAQTNADNIIAQAQEEANRMISDSEVLQAVHAEAKRVRDEVISECDEMKKQTTDDIEIARSNAINEAIQIREGADKYAEKVLDNLDADLTELHGIVKNGQRYMAKLKAEALANMTSNPKSPMTHNLRSEEEEEIREKIETL